MAQKSDPVRELRESFQEKWEPTVNFIAWAAGQSPHLDETPTADLVTVLKLKPSEAKDLFDGIKELGLAEYIVGRRNSPSRFRWLHSLSSISAVAKGEANQFEPVARLSGRGTNSAAGLPSGYVEHVLHRKGRKFALQLPEGFSQDDARWLTAILPNLADDSE